MLASCGLEFASSPISDVDRPHGHADGRRRCGHGRRGRGRGAAPSRRRLAADARRVTSVCSGAFVLAAAGLLRGRGHHPLGRVRAPATTPTRVSPSTPTPSTSATATCGPRPASPPASTSPSPWSPTTTATGRRDASPVNSSSTCSVRWPGPVLRALAAQAADTAPVSDLLVLAARPPRRRPLRDRPGPADQPVRTPVHAASSRPRSASPRPTTSKPSGSSRHAGCSRPRADRSSRSRGPAASAPPRP